MLTIRATRSAAYYERAEFSRDDYYTERGAARGAWAGRGAVALGLAGEVEAGGLGTLLDGRHPQDDVPLPGLRIGARRNAGFDLVFTAPKSVSVLLAIGDEVMRERIVAAHAAGVLAGLAYLDAHECQARRGAGGLTSIAAGGFVGAAFTHELSRAGDPHLHIHVVIANAVCGADGRWSAPDMRPVYAAAKTAGTIAEAVMRHELSRALGVRWEHPVKGSAEVRGVPAPVIDEFSSRRHEVLALAAARGAQGLKEVGALQRESRDRKRDVDREEARAAWRARAAEHGLGRSEIQAALGHEARRSARRGIARALAGPDGLTKHDSTFTRREVLRALAEAHPEGASLAGLERGTDRFLARHAVRLADEDPSGRPRFTTPGLLDVERRLLDLAGAVAPHLTAEPGAVEDALASRPWLGSDQVAAVRHAASDDGRVVLIEGRAGRGKTAALQALVEAYELSGMAVVGAAWQGQAAQVLQAGAGVPAQTLARLLGRLGRDPGALPMRPVVVLDEASMVPTRPLCALLEAIAGRDGRLVMVGDRRQLPSLEAGGAFAALADRLAAAELVQNRRQADEVGRRVADLLADGLAADALVLLEESGRLEICGDLEAARRLLVEEWFLTAAEADGPANALILAHDRAEVAELNRLARQALDEAGMLGGERLVASGREWAVGDRLIFRRNDYRAGIDLRNGTRGTVEAVAPASGTLNLRTDDGRRVVLPADCLEHAHHAYAVTGHVSQGVTTERTFLLATPDRAGAEWAYVAGSRHRLDLRAYAGGDERDEVRAALARTWERSQAKHLALDRLPLPGPEDLKALSWRELEERERRAAGRLEAMPHDPAPERRRLAAREAALTAQRLGAQARADSAGDRLARLGLVARLVRRREVAGLRAAQARALGEVAHAATERGRLQPKEAEVEAAERRLSAWREAHGPEFAARVALVQERERREELLLDAPPREIVALLGTPPSGRTERMRWQRAAVALDALREHVGPAGLARAVTSDAARDARRLMEAVRDAGRGHEIGR